MPCRAEAQLGHRAAGLVPGEEQLELFDSIHARPSWQEGDPEPPWCPLPSPLGVTGVTRSCEGLGDTGSCDSLTAEPQCHSKFYLPGKDARGVMAN